VTSKPKKFSSHFQQGKICKKEKEAGIRKIPASFLSGKTVASEPQAQIRRSGEVCRNTHKIR